MDNLSFMDHVIGKLWLFHCHGENQIDESRLLVLGWYPKVRAGFWMLIPSNMVVYNGNRFLTFFDPSPYLTDFETFRNDIPEFKLCIK